MRGLLLLPLLSAMAAPAADRVQLTLDASEAEAVPRSLVYRRLRHGGGGRQGGAAAESGALTRGAAPGRPGGGGRNRRYSSTLMTTRRLAARLARVRLSESGLLSP
jgi:hypothetical protein